MNQQWLLLWLLVAAIAIGFYLGRRDRYKKRTLLPPVSRDYWLGLTYLLDEQHDEAIEMFAKVLSEDDQAVETQLALGSLFRRRGEVDRAIATHQKILQNPTLNEEGFVRVYLELARDYAKAGLLDRAEESLQRVIDSTHPLRFKALEDLLLIFQQQKDWHQAIQVAEQLVQQKEYKKYAVLAAHFYCELAIKMMAQQDYFVARSYLKKAYECDALSVRTTLLWGQLEFAVGDRLAAIEAYKKIATQDPVFLMEAAPWVAQCFDELQQEDELVAYLYDCLQKNAAVPLIKMLAERIQQREGIKPALGFVRQQLQHHPSIRGLQYWLELQDEEAGKEHQLLKELTHQLTHQKPEYLCEQCGFSGKKMHWTCPTCKRWGTVKPLMGIEGKKRL